MDAETLLRAAREGDVATLERVLSLGLVPIDYADAVGDSALSLAAQKGHVSVVDALLARGASVLGADRDGDTALMCASWQGYAEIVDKLVLAGAVVDHTNNDRVTALMCAAENGHTRIVDALLAAGATVDLEDKAGDTALMCALITGHEQVVRRLLAAGADLRTINFGGETPLSRAQKKGHVEIVRIFQAFEASSMSLLAPVEAGQLAEVERLLAFKRADDRGPHGRTLAHVAAVHGRLEILKLLVNHNASLQVQDDAGWTPLHAASASGSLGCVRFILDCGVEMEIVDAQGLTPLAVAARNGHLAVVSELYQRGASMKNIARTGETVLHHAVVSQQAALVMFLLQHSGIDLDAVDDCGWTPLHYAVDSGNTAITSVLLLRGSDPNRKITTSRDGADGVTDLCASSSVLHMAVRVKNTELIAILFACGRVEVNARDDNGDTPLLLAVSMGASRVAATLIQLGADVGVRNFVGASPLSVAAHHGDEELNQLLLKHSAGAPTDGSHRDHSEDRFVEVGDSLDALAVLEARGPTSLELISPEQTHMGTNDRTDDESDAMATISREDTRCQHRGGNKCREPRTTKINGTLHKLCHLHRMKQNEKKRRSSTRHKHNSLVQTRSRPHVSESMECKYAGHPCSLPRDIKPNGEPHLFCKFHRLRHNTNQRRVDRRRRHQRSHEVHEDAELSTN